MTATTIAIVICAETFRADHLGCHGAGWIKTPRLETTDVAPDHPTIVGDLLDRLQNVMAAPPPARADPH
jgi:hypothetical protein